MTGTINDGSAACHACGLSTIQSLGSQDVQNHSQRLLLGCVNSQSNDVESHNLGKTFLRDCMDGMGKKRGGGGNSVSAKVKLMNLGR